MKIKSLLVVAITVLASSVMAQSAFEGFYAQVATGYENNSASGLNSPLTATDGIRTASIGAASASNQSFGGLPLVAGIGYNFSVVPKWLVGLGADYSFLPQESSRYGYSLEILGFPSSAVTVTGAQIKTSNRYNIFLAPGYEISANQLVYLKAGIVL